MIIVKVQRPLGGSPDVEHKLLVYDEDHLLTVYLTATKARMETYFPNAELKVYRHAALNDQGGFDIFGPAPEQPW